MLKYLLVLASFMLANAEHMTREQARAESKFRMETSKILARQANNVRKLHAITSHFMSEDARSTLLNTYAKNSVEFQQELNTLVADFENAKLKS